jgi:chloramphenicol 3-O phosphotransferase
MDADVRDPASGGIIVVLNGTSSAGKTSLAKHLQEALPEPYFHLGADHLVPMYPPKPFDAKGHLALFTAFHQAIATLAEAGGNAVVDHVLSTRTWLRELADLLADRRAYLVGVRCPLEVVEARERGRDDRRVGTARDQYSHVHAHGEYDFEVDTAAGSIEECAGRILDWLRTAPAPRAFGRLRDSAYLADMEAPGWVLHRGMAGPGVRRLQRELARLGYGSGEPDGVFGPRTDAALRAFQRDQGLRPDGGTWPRTLNALRAALRAAPAQPLVEAP